MQAIERNRGMTTPATLPNRADVRILGFGKARKIRALYVDRCSVPEIAHWLGVTREYVSHCLRWKAGDRPLAGRGLA